MDIKLTQLFFAFFLRTEFVDIADTEKEIRKLVYGFDKANKQTFPNIQFPQRVPTPNLPLFSLVFNQQTITVHKDKIEYSLNGIYDDKDYDDCIGFFAATVKPIVSFCTSEDNICSRVGIVNNTFIVTDNQDDLIKKSFFKENISNINNITLSYIRYNKYEDINIVELNSISQGILNTKPSQNGILIIRDINIPQKRKKITESDIDIFIKNAFPCIKKSSMIKDIS